VSWRERAAARRERDEEEGRRYERSEGAGLRKFLRYLVAPTVTVVALVAMHGTLSTRVLFALGGVALLLMLGWAKATRARSER